MKIKCPKCSHGESKTVEGRPRHNGLIFRRRRECKKCGFRWTTLETARASMTQDHELARKLALEMITEIRQRLRALELIIV